MRNIVLIFVFSLLTFSCEGKNKTLNTPKKVKKNTQNITTYDSLNPTIHIMVALCDNQYQGIVPVPAKIGNGQDPANNLYWGCAYGIKGFFNKSKEWKLLKTTKLNDTLMERLVFKHRLKNYYLIADAYNGKYIQHCTDLFLKSNAGQLKDTIHSDGKVLGINGNAKLLTYIGHDGLMDFALENTYQNTDGKTRDCVILACVSKHYFSPYIKTANANPLVWSTNLMAPEAYIIHDAITGYIAEESPEKIRERAALAYSKYQKVSLKAAKNLLVTGF